MDGDIIIEKVEQNPEGENSERVHYRSIRAGQSGLDWKLKLKLAALVIGGIAVGTVLFLFFVGFFIYFFIPLVVIFSLWSFFTQRR